MAEIYRTGIIGCGGMGRAHSNAYTQNPATELVAAMDVNTESAKRLSEEFSVPAVYTDYKQMLEKEALDIVSITTWQGVRAEITVAAAKAGSQRHHWRKTDGSVPRGSGRYDRGV